MNKLIWFLVVLFMLTFAKVSTQKVTAELYIISYEPTINFRLVFSEPVKLPQFQILLNNNNLLYNVKTESLFAEIYQMALTGSIHNYKSQVESYSLIFNFPLNIADGRLSLDSFILQPIRAPVLHTIQNWPAYLLLFFAYLFSLFGIIGLWLIDFIQIFILIQYKFSHTTTIYQFIGDSFFFNKVSQPISEAQFQKYLLELISPLILVIATFFISLTIKQALKQVKSLYLLHVKYFFEYNFFLTVWSIFSAPILYQACQHIYLRNHNNFIKFSPNQHFYCIIATYMNLLSTFLYLYLMWFTLNKKPFQDDESFQQFMQSQDFQKFHKFHKAIGMNSWYMRNYVIFTALRKFSVVIMFFVFSTLADKVAIEQALLMFYVFIIRPYKQQFYINSSIILTLLLFFCFLIVVDGNLYFSMSDVLDSEASINDFLQAKNITFLIVCVTILVFSGVQNYQILMHIRYQNKLFSQSKEISFSEDNQSTARKRLYTQTSQESITKRMAKRSQIPQLQDMSASIIFSRDSPPKKLQSKDKNSSSKAKLNLFQIELQQIKSPSIFQRRMSSNKANLTGSISLNKIVNGKSIQASNDFSSILSNNKVAHDKKWKQKSLLQQLADRKNPINRQFNDKQSTDKNKNIVKDNGDENLSDDLVQNQKF